MWITKKTLGKEHYHENSRNKKKIDEHNLRPTHKGSMNSILKDLVLTLQGNSRGGNRKGWKETMFKDLKGKQNWWEDKAGNYRQHNQY